MESLLLSQASENEKNGDWASAEILYRGLLKDRPGHPAATLALGTLLLRRGAIEESGDLLDQAVNADPASSEAHVQLAAFWQTVGRPERAMQALLIATCLQGVKINPNDVQSRFQLGIALNQADRHRDAAGAYRQALALQPDFAEIHNNLGISLQNLQCASEAIAAHRRAVALSPTNAGHHCNLAHALLSAGMLREGFAEWEWRTASPPRHFAQPQWDGKAYHGQTLLAYAEQGYGDTMQFCRFLPDAAARGGRLLVECRRPLRGLLERMLGIVEVIEWGQALPAFDLQIAIPSLPHALGVGGTPLPPAAAYLEAATDHATLWRERIGPARCKVGLVWAGNAAGHDPKRAIPPRGFADLAAIPGVSLFSLQRDAAAIIDQDLGGKIVDLGPSIADFDDLAGAIDGLDLVISVDTATAHLAGAMGKPVWTLLHASPDWRWLPEAVSTPWYPSMRLYRQAKAGDWAELLRRVAGDLALYSSRCVRSRRS